MATDDLPRTLAGSRQRSFGRAPIGRRRSSRRCWSRTSSLWAPLLVVLVICGYFCNWLPPSLIPGRRVSPYSSASTVDLLQTLAERPLLNPWTRPGSIRNRTTVPIDLPKGIADSELLRRVRWAPSPADDIHPDYGQDGGASLMSLLADAVREGTVPVDWEWAANKTILGIGDSLMRNNVMFFADHVSQGKFQRELLPLQGRDGTPWELSQGMGVVDVPELGLKVAQWFHQGMIEQEISGFYDGINNPHDFESRLKHVWLGTVDHPLGLDGREPDLIIFESLSWDLLFLATLARGNGDKRFDGRPLDEKEIDWIQARQAEVLRLLRETFPTSKIVVQTAHLGAKSPESFFAPIRCLQQAEYVRSVALETGLELFDWGRIVSPLSNEMTDGLHYVAGVATWLWGEMTLSYLRRAHFHPVDPPPLLVPKSKRISQKDLAESYRGPSLIQYTEPGISTGTNEKSWLRYSLRPGTPLCCASVDRPKARHA